MGEPYLINRLRASRAIDPVAKPRLMQRNSLRCWRSSGPPPSSTAPPLLHGDFHLLGNIFIAKESTNVSPIKVIDWGQAKRGLGPHDLMFALLAVEVPDRRSPEPTHRKSLDSSALSRGHSVPHTGQCSNFHRCVSPSPRQSRDAHPGSRAVSFHFQWSTPFQGGMMSM